MAGIRCSSAASLVASWLRRETSSSFSLFSLGNDMSLPNITGRSKVFRRFSQAQLQPRKEEKVTTPLLEAYESNPILGLRKSPEFVPAKLPVSLPLLSISSEAVTIKEDRTSIAVPLLWLRDSCTCEQCVNQGAYQRNSWTLVTDAQIKRAEVNNGFLHAVWTDGHASHYDLSAIKNHFTAALPKKSSDKQVAKFLWDRQRLGPASVVPISHDAVFTDSGLGDLLTNIQRFGFGLVDCCPPTEAATEKLVKRVAPPMPTTFSPGMWTFTSNMERNDTAYSNVYLAPHTDTTYFSNPARIQVFHCLERDGCTGGENLLVDAFHCADVLQQTDAAAYERLCSTAQNCVYMEPDVCYKWTDVVLTRNTDRKSLQRVRFNMYDRSTAPPLCAPSEMNAFYRSLRTFADLTQSAVNQHVLTLTPGLVIFIDNWRVLHGRNAFNGKRVLTGCYMSNDEFEHNCRRFSLIP
ncbi:trimethyllysine dioxygenase, mitochondrial-like [Paramacrobiotus metropolitanus]|uniref:trimethyllysine dioxygenase, mitochondrial-like n=1 Tax=Paramacrobiotus metropolitanus TaxID=2943436 RepID=UPI0024461DCB|nr:trimethyllysine dioxygenase, mitochondrial-like [Paramacrobiotus metropolitanus]